LSSGKRRRRGNLLQVLLLPFLALQATFFALWLVRLVLYGPEDSDWRHLKVVADHFVAGDWSNLYETGARAINPQYLWLYPPYALYLVAPLAWLTPLHAYLWLAGIGAASLVLSLVLLRRLAPPAGVDTEWFLASVFWAPALATIVMGQSSALLLLFVTGAAYVWQQGDGLRAHGLLALFALKPNWGLFFGLFALVRRDYRGALVMVGIVLALCAITIPLGTEVWTEFLRASASNAELFANYPSYKLISLKAFLTATLGQSPVTTGVWAVAAVALGGIVCAAWRVRGRPVRHLGLAVLLAIAANPYANFYDALVLILPATVWWSERASWRRIPWLIVGWLIAAIWCWQQYSFAWALVVKAELGVESPYPPLSIVGPAASVWLVLAAREAIATGRNSSGLDGPLP
jgi:hypothetical protein